MWVVEPMCAHYVGTCEQHGRCNKGVSGVAKCDASLCHFPHHVARLSRPHPTWCVQSAAQLKGVQGIGKSSLAKVTEVGTRLMA